VTIAVAVKTESALVFAADSKVTTSGVAGMNPDGKPHWVEQTYDNAVKVAHDRNRLLMGMVAGHANLGPLPATDFIRRQSIPLMDSPEGQDQQIGELLTKMATMHERYWAKSPADRKDWPGPTLLLALPAHNDAAPRQRGIWLEGAYFEVYTLLYGHHPAVLTALAQAVGTDVDTVNQKTAALGVLRPIDKLNSVPGMPSSRRC